MSMLSLVKAAITAAASFDCSDSEIKSCVSDWYSQRLEC